jgi:hypothetical protein
MSDSSEQLEREARKPQSVSIPGLSVGRHSLRDQIELDKHLARKRTAQSKLGGIRMMKTSPPPTG